MTDNARVALPTTSPSFATRFTPLSHSATSITGFLFDVSVACFPLGISLTGCFPLAASAVAGRIFNPSAICVPFGKSLRRTERRPRPSRMSIT